MKAKYEPTLKGTRTTIRKWIIAEIEREPNRYIELFRNNKFELDSNLNYYALVAFASSVDNIEKYKEDFEKVIKVLLMEVSNGEGESIRNYVLEDFWTIQQDYGHRLSILINNKIRELYSEIDNISEIIRVALDYFEDPEFWAHQNHRDDFINPIFEILERDDRLKSVDRDNLVEPFLKNVTQIEDDGFKRGFQEKRQKVFELLSVNSKKRTLNQIWTLFPKLTDITPDNPDLVFLMGNIENCKDSDKREILNELLEQLTSGSDKGRALFEKFGGLESIIKVNPNLWCEELATYVVQQPYDLKIIKKIVEDNIDLIPKSEKRETLMDCIKEN